MDKTETLKGRTEIVIRDQDLLKEMEHFLTDTDWQRCQ